MSQLFLESCTLMYINVLYDTQLVDIITVHTVFTAILLGTDIAILTMFLCELKRDVTQNNACKNSKLI